MTVLPEIVRERLIDLFVLFVIQRFSTLSRAEVEDMLKLTPLDETTAGRELIEQGIEFDTLVKKDGQWKITRRKKGRQNDITIQSRYSDDRLGGLGT